MPDQEAQLKPDDVQWSATIAIAALQPALALDWTVPAGDLEWDCRRTLNHIVDSLLLYSAYLASRATARLTPPRNGDPEASPEQGISSLRVAADIFAEVGRAAPDGVRAFHPAGMADLSGWMALGCEEIILHTQDIALGLGIAFSPPEELTGRILARLFPWAHPEEQPWEALRWAAGRTALPDRARLGPNWGWQCAPLAEWDGTVRQRSAPPAW